MAISRKPISIKDVAFRTSFGLGPEKTENQGPNRERKAGRWGESMVRRGALERCETGANPLETRGKRKPVTPENDPRETGLSFLNGGGNADLPQNSLKARAPRNSLIINAEVISHNHFPPTRPEKRISPLISRHRTRVTGLQ
jgi:hypothetical protein